MDVEFKLFGSLTIKQFGSLAVCFLFALLVHVSNIPSLIGFPLKVGFVLLGIALAFMKVQGQSFDKFLTNFLLAMLVPQRMVWKKENKAPISLVGTFSVPKKTDRDRKSELLKEIFSNYDKSFQKESPTIGGYEKTIMENIDRYITQSQKSALSSGGFRPKSIKT